MDNMNSLPPITLTPLRRVEHPKGDILHGIKVSDPGYVGFGEAYFTTIVAGEVKGWKKHSAMTMNIIVPLGMVRFHIHDQAAGKTSAHDVGYLNYRRLTIPPGYWVAFQGLTNQTNLILNVANLEHDPVEAINAPFENFPLTMS
jgi:dTDP-4-dehydrorhamnose 3,5-epimerase